LRLSQGTRRSHGYYWEQRWGWVRRVRSAGQAGALQAYTVRPAVRGNWLSPGQTYREESPVRLSTRQYFHTTEHTISIIALWQQRDNVSGGTHLPIDHSHAAEERYALDLRQPGEAITAGHFPLGAASPLGETFAFTNYYLTYNGRPFLPIMGEFHYSRFPRQYWKEELQKMQAGGITLVASYIFWIHVEEEEGVFDWSGDRDLRAFVRTCQELDLPIILRIGPFAHGECRNGGLPDWLYGRGIPVRSNDERYLRYVQRFFTQIAEQVQGFLFKEGG